MSQNTAYEPKKKETELIPAATKSKINESYDGGSDSGLDFDYRSKNKNKIMVTGPIVDICGDQMAAIMW